MLKLLFKDSVIYTIPNLFSKGLGILVIPIYTRALTQTEYGNLDLLIVVANLVNLTIAFEVSQGVARFYTTEKKKNNQKKIVSSAFIFFVICHLFFLGAVNYFALPMSAFIIGPGADSTIFMLGMVYASVHGLFGFVQNQYRWDLKSIQYASLSISTSVLSIIFAIYLAIFMDQGLTGIIIGQCLGNTLGVIVGLYFQRKVFFNGFSLKYLWQMLSFSLPLVPAGLAIFFSNYLDRFMINQMVGLEAVAIYGVGFRVAGLIGITIIGLKGALMPAIYRYHDDASTPIKIEQTFRIFITGALFFSLIIILFSDVIITLLSGQLYMPASSVVPFLIVGIILTQTYIFTPGMALAKKTALILFVNVVGIFVNAVMNFYLIPKFGILGASIATFFSGLSLFSLNMYYSQRFYFVPHDWRKILIVLISFTTLILSSFLGLEDLFLELLMSFTLLSLMIIITYKFDLVKRDEWSFFLNFYKSLRLKRG